MFTALRSLQGFLGEAVRSGARGRALWDGEKLWAGGRFAAPAGAAGGVRAQARGGAEEDVCERVCGSLGEYLQPSQEAGPRGASAGATGRRGRLDWQRTPPPGSSRVSVTVACVF